MIAVTQCGPFHALERLRTCLQHWQGLLVLWVVEAAWTTSSEATSSRQQSLPPAASRGELHCATVHITDPSLAMEDQLQFLDV